MSGLKFDAQRVRGKVYWDIDLEQEFKEPRRTGYAFVIDVCDGIPRLALYCMKLSYSTSTTLHEQPPRRLLERAVTERGGNLGTENLYPVNREVRNWIEQNLLA